MGTLSLLRDRLARIGVALTVVVALAGVAQLILVGTVWPSGTYDHETGIDPTITHPSGVSISHPLGTDPLGRDVLSMTMAGARPAVVVAATSATVAAASGLLVAGLAVAGGVGRAFSWTLTNVALLLPAPVVAVIIGSGPLRETLTSAGIGILFGALAGSSTAALLIRSRLLDLAHSGFVDAARVSGSSRWRVFWFHLLPHVFPIAVVNAFLIGAAAVVADGFLALLSFTETRFNWGSVVGFALVFRSIDGNISWNVLLATGVALSSLTLGLFLIGAGVRRRSLALYRVGRGNG